VEDKEIMDMDIKVFKDKVFIKAEKEGFQEYEIYYSKSDKLNIQVYNQEVDKYSVCNTLGVSFRGLFNGKMGYSYTETLDDISVDILIESAKESAIIIESEYEEYIYGIKETYTELNAFNTELCSISTDEKINLALSLEKEAKKKSDKVTNIGYCAVNTEEYEYGIMNSKGIDVMHKANYIFGAVSPVVTDEDRKYDGISYRVDKDFHKIDAKVIAEEAVKEALACIGAASVKSGNYKVVLKNEVAAALLMTFSGAFSAENVQKGLSLLKNKIGEKVAAASINIIDDPHAYNGLASTPFDAEGVATIKKHIIKDGKLLTYLHNLKTAAKDGIKSTGNASKASYGSPISISPSNFYFEKGDKSFDEIIKIVGEGLLITDLAGMHSGADPVTGDFSLAAKGFVIKAGEITNPVEQITIAGNFLKMLELIELIGDDFKFTLNSSNGYFGSPSLVISSISIAGD
jgi:PmbA protein